MTDQELKDLVTGLAIAQAKLNHRLRKILRFKTPYEVFYGKILEAS